MLTYLSFIILSFPILFKYATVILLNTNLDGELSEWLKEMVLKTIDLNGSESSNLSLSAKGF